MKGGKLSAYPFERIVTHSEPIRKELLTPEEGSGSRIWR